MLNDVENRCAPDGSSWKAMGMLEPTWRCEIAAFLAKNYVAMVNDMIPSIQTQEAVEKYGARKSADLVEGQILAATARF